MRPLKDIENVFVAKYGGVYEHSPWVAKAAFKAGIPDLSLEMRKVVEAAGADAQLTLLRAHPDLAGKLAKSGTLTQESTSEQASAGLDQCTAAEFAEFTMLNDSYKAKFGFPYILAVKGRHRREILENFRNRINNTPKQEFREALDQVHQIAKLRLADIL